MTEDQRLLSEYVRDQSRAALNELIRRHIDLVYSSALRQTRDSHLAQDVTQGVFLVLMQKAGTIRHGAALAGWLMSVTRWLCVNAMKKQATRHRHEFAAAKAEAVTDPDQDWRQISPLLDEGLSRLSAKERDAVVLRFLQSRSYAEVAAEVGTTEEAARKRADRAIVRLRTFMTRRGVTVSVAALCTAGAAHAVQAAAPEVIQGALAVGSGTATATPAVSLANGALRMMGWQKSAIAAGVTLAVIAGGAAAIAWHFAASSTQNLPPPAAIAQPTAPAPVTPLPNTMTVKGGGGAPLLFAQVTSPPNAPAHSPHDTNVNLNRPFLNGAPISADEQARIAKELTDADPAVQNKGLDELYDLLHSDPRSWGYALPKWSDGLLSAKFYDDAVKFAPLGIMERGLDPVAVEADQRMMALAVYGQAKYADALPEAKCYYDVASLANTPKAVAVMANVLAHTSDLTVAQAFINQQATAPPADAPTSRPSEIFASITADGHRYDDATRYFEMTYPVDKRPFLVLLSMADDTLAEDRVADAKAFYEQAVHASDASAKQVRMGLEGIARCMRDQDGNVARANAFILAIRQDPATATSLREQDRPTLPVLQSAANAIKLADPAEISAMTVDAPELAHP